jgi:predicted PurR-regulated permease PerM
MNTPEKKSELVAGSTTETPSKVETLSPSEPQVVDEKSSDDSQPHSLMSADNKRRINQYAILGMLLLVTVAFIPVVQMFFVPVLVASSFTSLFYPVYLWFFNVFRKNKAFAAFTTSLLLFLLLVIPLYIVIHLFTLQVLDIYKTAGPFLTMLTEKISKNNLTGFLQTLPFLSNVDLNAIDWSKLLNESVKTIASSGSTILNKTSAGILGLVVNIFILFFTMFYLFMDGKEIVKRIQFLSPIRNDYEDLIFNRFLLISRATVAGTLVIGLVQGSFGAIALLIFGIKSWLLWGFMMIVLSIIPLVGPWVVLIPAGIIQFFLGNIWQGIGLILFSVIVVSNIDNLLRPRVVGQGAKLHDLIVFFSSLGGIAVFGVMGFIVGPVIASLFVSVLDIYSTEFKDQLKAMNEHTAQG